MSERAQARLRELKEAAQAQFIQGRYAECAETCAHVLRMVPRDPNAHLRHAEASRRAGVPQAAVASYRATAALLLAQGSESRARAALRAALELAPGDPLLTSEFARLGQAPLPLSTALEDERLYSHAADVMDARGLTPPPPPPPFVLRAAEEARTGGPLPAAPAIAPVSVKPARPASGQVVNACAPMQVTPGSTRAVGTPSAPASGNARGASKTPAKPLPLAQPPMTAFPPRGAVAPRQVEMPRAVTVTVTPSRVTVHEPAPAAPYRPELRWLGPNTLALRVSPHAGWVLIRADSPLALSRAETLPTTAPSDPLHPPSDAPIVMGQLLPSH